MKHAKMLEELAKDQAEVAGTERDLPCLALLGL